MDFVGSTDFMDFGLYRQHGVVELSGSYGAYVLFDCANMSVRTPSACVYVYDAYLVGLTCLFHAFSAGVCWRARRVAGLRTARCAASCADLCAVSCAARSAVPCEAVCSLLKKEKKKKEKRRKRKKEEKRMFGKKTQ